MVRQQIHLGMLLIKNQLNWFSNYKIGYLPIVRHITARPTTVKQKNTIKKSKDTILQIFTQILLISSKL